VPGDRTYLNEALSILLRGAVERTAAGVDVRIRIEAVAGSVRLMATHGIGELPAIDRALVRQLSSASGFLLTDSGDSTVVTLSSAPP
jgi:hypothetical protein